MENKPRFDLNTALHNWREELSAQPSLSLDEQRELESHLLDTITDLRKRGLNAEEAFWLARRRLGPAQEISKEFTKANPAKAWRERLFWGALTILILQLWSLTFGTLSQAAGVIALVVAGAPIDFSPSGIPSHPPSGTSSPWLTSAFDCMMAVIYFLPFIYALASLGRNKPNMATRALDYALRSRFRLLSLATVSYLILAALCICLNAKLVRSLPFYNLAMITAPIRNVGLIALACWLMPSRPQTDTTEGTLQKV